MAALTGHTTSLGGAPDVKSNVCRRGADYPELTRPRDVMKILTGHFRVYLLLGRRAVPAESLPSVSLSAPVAS
jgi:hypothetical protein